MTTAGDTDVIGGIKGERRRGGIAERVLDGMRTLNGMRTFGGVEAE